MAGRADSVMAQDFLTDVDAPALLGRLKEAVYRGRIRMSTFFEDHDRLRTGLVTEGKFRTAIEASGIAELENPSVALWALISYTYFDTRWTPLAGVNLYDVDRSLLARDGFRRNSPEAFPLIRIAFLFRGAQARCGVFDLSLVDAWLPDALRRLGRPVRFSRVVSRCRAATRRKQREQSEASMLAARQQAKDAQQEKAFAFTLFATSSSVKVEPLNGGRIDTGAAGVTSKRVPPSAPTYKSDAAKVAPPKASSKQDSAAIRAADDDDGKMGYAERMELEEAIGSRPKPHTSHPISPTTGTRSGWSSRRRSASRSGRRTCR